MATKEKLRNRILNRIKKLSEDKLSNLDAYINDLEGRFSSEKSSLSFSGIFNGLELDELTSELHKSRGEDNSRIPEL